MQLKACLHARTEPGESGSPESGEHHGCTPARTPGTTAQVTVAPREYRRGVEPGPGDTAHRPGLGDDLGRPQQRLARHARPVRALAANKLGETELLEDAEFVG
jgi:hypothetical protein